MHVSQLTYWSDSDNLGLAGKQCHCIGISAKGCYCPIHINLLLTQQGICNRDCAKLITDENITLSTVLRDNFFRLPFVVVFILSACLAHMIPGYLVFDLSPLNDRILVSFLFSMPTYFLCCWVSYSLLFGVFTFKNIRMPRPSIYMLVSFWFSRLTYLFSVKTIGYYITFCFVSSL